jgi:hypothetical protein
MVTIKKEYIALFVAIALIAGFLGTGPFAIQGSQIISISQTDYSSTGDAFQKQFIATVQLNGGGDFLDAKYTDYTQAKDQDTSTSAQQKFRVGFDLTDVNCRYSIPQTATTINKIDTTCTSYN